MLDRKVAPIAHDIQGMTLVKPEEMVFSNGLKTFVFRATAIDLIKVEFVFENIYLKGENMLLNTAVGGLIKEGTRTLTSAEIADKVDYYGAYLIPEFSFDQTSLILYTVKKYVHEVFPIVLSILQEATFPEHELETFIRNNKQVLSISLEKNEFVAKRLFYRNLFGDTPYGYMTDEKDLDALNQEAIIRLYQRQFTPANCTLFLSGNISDEVLAAAASLFGEHWQRETSVSNEEREKVILSPNTKELIVEEKTDSLQSAIRIGLPTIGRQDEEYPSLQFVNTILGGYFGSRLMQNIREEKGYTYGINSSVLSLRHSGLMTIITQVGAEFTKSTLLEIQKEIERLQNTLVEQTEIELVRNYLLGAMLGSLESIFSHADKFKAVYFSGMDLAYYDAYTAQIKSIDAGKIQQVAQKYFSFDDMTKVVVGKYSS